jgi:hypothetical protein
MGHSNNSILQSTRIPSRLLETKVFGRRATDFISQRLIDIFFGMTPILILVLHFGNIFSAKHKCWSSEGEGKECVLSAGLLLPEGR